MTGAVLAFTRFVSAAMSMKGWREGLVNVQQINAPQIKRPAD
jgi:hypothetical protein